MLISQRNRFYYGIWFLFRIYHTLFSSCGMKSLSFNKFVFDVTGSSAQCILEIVPQTCYGDLKKKTIGVDHDAI